MSLSSRPTDRPEIEDSRARGRREAEELDRRLAALERRERDERLTEIGGQRSLVQERLERAEVLTRQQREIARLNDWHAAVVHSRAWRLVQALRRPFGRAW